jgi:hypothetical protein
LQIRQLHSFAEDEGNLLSWFEYSAGGTGRDDVMEELIGGYIVLSREQDVTDDDITDLRRNSNPIMRQ